MLPHLWKKPGSVHKLKGAIFEGKYSFALIFNMPRKTSIEFLMSFLGYNYKYFFNRSKLIFYTYFFKHLSKVLFAMK